MNRLQPDSQSGDTMQNEDYLNLDELLQFARKITDGDWSDEHPETDVSVVVDEHHDTDVSMAVDERILPGSRNRLSLDERFERIREEAAIANTAKATFGNPGRNTLLAAEQERLTKLAQNIARIVPINGSEDTIGFENPQISFRRVLAGKTADDIDTMSFNLMKEVVEELTVLWEGKKAMSGVSLARNAVLHIVLRDKHMREKAFASAADWLAECAETVERSDIPLK